MMHQPLENTAYCLNCANEWPVVWDREKHPLECPACRWHLGIPVQLVSSGWWMTREPDRDTSSTEARRNGEEHREERRRERAEFARDVRKGLEQLPVIGPSGPRSSRGWTGNEAAG